MQGRRRTGDEGFTLVELLVVVVIIGILVGIAIPVYLNYRKSSYEATAQSDLRMIQLEQRNYEANNATFGSTRQLAAANPDLRLSEGSVAAVVWSSDDGFCAGATNTKAPRDNSAPFAGYGFPYKTFFFDSTTGKTTTIMCSPPSGANGIDGSHFDEGGVN